MTSMKFFIPHNKRENWRKKVKKQKYPFHKCKLKWKTLHFVEAKWKQSHTAFFFLSFPFSFPLISWIYGLLLLVFFPSSRLHCHNVCVFVRSFYDRCCQRAHSTYISLFMKLWPEPLKPLTNARWYQFSPFSFFRNHRTFHRPISPLHLTALCHLPIQRTKPKYSL